MKKCETGCKVFTGGEIKHHKDCCFYKDSLSEKIDILDANKLETKQLLMKAHRKSLVCGIHYDLSIIIEKALKLNI